MRRTTAFLIALVCALAAAMVLALPLMRFTAALETKRSPNTFVGDENYMAARQEMEEKQAAYAAEGISTEVTEEVIERTNSKGVKTSLVVFRLNSENTRTGFQMMGAGLGVSRVMIALLVCLGLAAVCLGLGLRENGKRRPLTSVGVAFSLAIPVMIIAVPMMFNLDFSRKATLLAGGHFPGDPAPYLAQMDRFLFDGAAGDRTESMLTSMSCGMSGLWWMTILPAAGLLLCALYLRKDQVKEPLGRVALYTVVILFSVFILYPFAVMLFTAFRSNAEATDMYFLHIMPSIWQWNNLTETLERGVLRYLGNSLLISFGATGVAMLCGIPAAYAMARMRFRGRKVYLGFVIMSQMFSPVVLLVGISRLMTTIHLNDTLVGLMFINAAFNQAFAIWLLRGTFVSISSEMEQAACIDGCNTLQALIRILLPMAAPGIVTTLIFVFINSWNEYTISTILISTQQNRPITVGITQFSSFNMIEWQYLFMAALLATIPVVILFILIEKHLAEGLTAGGVKG